jgi:synaptojanin
MACLRFSDHRPVWASFECMISIVDEQMKGALREALFNESHREVNRLTRSKTGDDEDADSMIYRPIAPGYPSASSDSHKWWLDEGMRSQSLSGLPVILADGATRGSSAIPNKASYEGRNSKYTSNI